MRIFINSLLHPYSGSFSLGVDHPCRQEGHLKCNTWNALLICFICTSGSVYFFCTFFALNLGFLSTSTTLPIKRNLTFFCLLLPSSNPVGIQCCTYPALLWWVVRLRCALPADMGAHRSLLTCMAY